MYRDYMILLKHDDNKDIAIKILSEKGFLWWKKYFVEFYNVNYHKISGNLPLYVCSDWVKIKDFDKYQSVCYQLEER